MKVTLPGSASADDILGLVEQFVDHLATGNYERAYAILQQTRFYSHWTPDLINEVIESYGPPIGATNEERSHVTPRATAVVIDFNPRHEVTFDEEPSTLIDAAVGDVHYDLPINGVWSDLTAIFAIHRSDDAVWLELEDIHVL